MLKKILLPVIFVILGYGFWVSPNVKEIAAGVSIFLFGMLFLEEGFKAFTGGLLEKLLKKTTDRQWKAVAFGILTTTIMQSSSLVSVITISFLSAGLIWLASGIGIIFGANIGTTTGAWLVAGFGLKVKISAYAMPMLVFGIILVFQSQKALKGIGYILAGLGFLFLGIHHMKEGFEVFRETIDLAEYAMPGFLGLIVFTLMGTVATVIMQSSHATLVLIITALAAGQITYENALALAIGAHIGKVPDYGLGVSEVVHQGCRQQRRELTIADHVVHGVLEQQVVLVDGNLEFVENQNIAFFVIHLPQFMDRAHDTGDLVAYEIVLPADILVVGTDVFQGVGAQMVDALDAEDDAMAGVTEFVEAAAKFGRDLVVGLADELQNGRVKRLHGADVGLLHVVFVGFHRGLYVGFEVAVRLDDGALQGQSPRHHLKGIVVKVLGFLADRIEKGLREAEGGIGDEPRFRRLHLRFRDDPLQEADQPAGQRPHHANADDVEDRVEHGELQRVVIGGDADPDGNRIDHPDDLVDEGDGDGAGDAVEDQMCRGQAFALIVGAHGADDGGDGGADIGKALYGAHDAIEKEVEDVLSLTEEDVDELRSDAA